MPQHEIIKKRRYWPLVLGLTGSGALLCLAISLAWHFAAAAAGGALDALILKEQKHGRVWSCPERRIAGFPFAIELACVEPRFAGLVSGVQTEVQAKALHARFSLFRPTEVTAEIEAPFALRSADGRTDISARWTSLQIVASGAPQEPKRILFRGQAVAIHGFTEALGTLAAEAAQCDGAIAKAASAEPHAYDFRLAAQDIANPLLATALGSQRIDEFKTGGTITEAVFDPSVRPAHNLEQWRMRGGRIDFANLDLSQAETRVSAQGTLMLDAAHRPQGKFDTQSVGLEPILQRHGINPSLVTAGVLLSGLLGGGSASAGKPGELRLPVRAEGGGLTIGPVKTAVRLSPLY
jgi:hypothetical protein